MSDSTPTERIGRQPLRISPEAQVLVKSGSLLTGAGALVAATIFVWGIKSNSEQALAEMRSMREELTPAMKKIDRLWWEYENRYANRSLPTPSIP